MIRVCYSNRVEQLIDALAGALPPPGDLDAMFAGPWLTVPSRPLELYVDLELARRRGISGNVDTMSMPGAFARLCAEALPDVVLIERGHIVGELLAALSDPGVDSDVALAPLHGYLRAAGAAADAVDRRRVDIARALGALFDDWILTRPELRGGIDAATAHPLARVQRALWDDLFGTDGRFARRSASEKRRYLTLPDVLLQRLDDDWRPPGAMHLFCPSQVSRGLQIALDRLGARTEVTLYAVNPCREFWEDVSTSRRQRGRPGIPVGAIGPGRRAQGRRPDTSRGQGDVRQLELTGLAAVVAVAPIEPASDPENPLLRLWGHAGRELTRLLNDLSHGNFDDRFVEPIATGDAFSKPRPTLLACLQQDLLARQPLSAADRHLDLDLDDSIAILGAPNPRRELETIAADIWELVRDDDATPPGDAMSARPPALRFSDIAVLIAGPDDPYLALARAVFREANDLPHTIVDQPLAASSQLVDAVLALLALPLGKFTRREVLDVITHPNVRARFPDADPQIWLELCDALTIAHGADRADFAGSYVDADLFNWDQGCKRLALGVFARGPRSGIEDPIHLPDGAYLPAEIAADLRPDADALALLVRSLLADARFAQTARMPLSDWMRFVRALCSAYVIPTTANDEAARLRVFAALDQIAAQAPPDLPASISVAHQLIGESLTGLRTGRGQILGAGVTVGTLAALRGLPFRVIFIAGVGAERFPAADRPSPLDLDADPRRPAEVTPRQQDRYLMLEALLATRDKLVLSYLDRDALTGDPRDPSPVVLEFLDELQRGTARGCVTRSVPLHRDEDPKICAAFPGAAAESRARQIGESLRGDLPEVARLGTTAIARGLSQGARRILDPLLRTVTSPQIDKADARVEPSFHNRVLHLTDLRRFLECPLQGSARVFLGLRDLPDDTEAREIGDEPFDVARYRERSLLGDVFLAAWTGADLPNASILSHCYDAALSRQRTGHILPAGVFRGSVRRRHLGILNQWTLSLAAATQLPRGPIRRVCFGRPQPFAPPADQRDPIRLSIDVDGDGPRTVEIHGITEPQLAFADQRGSLILDSSEDKQRNDKDSLRAFVDYVALAASAAEVDPSTGFQGAICRPSKDGKTSPPTALPFAGLDRTRARDYLAQLAGDLLGRVHAYLFPCEAVFFTAGRDLSLTDRIRKIQGDPFLRRYSSSSRGPVPDPFAYPVPKPDEADRLLEHRFGLYFELLGDSRSGHSGRKP